MRKENKISDKLSAPQNEKANANPAQKTGFRQGVSPLGIDVRRLFCLVARHIWPITASIIRFYVK